MTWLRKQQPIIHYPTCETIIPNEPEPVIKKRRSSLTEKMKAALIEWMKHRLCCSVSPVEIKANEKQSDECKLVKALENTYSNSSLSSTSSAITCARKESNDNWRSIFNNLLRDDSGNDFALQLFFASMAAGLFHYTFKFDNSKDASFLVCSTEPKITEVTDDLFDWNDEGPTEDSNESTVMGSISDDESKPGILKGILKNEFKEDNHKSMKSVKFQDDIVIGITHSGDEYERKGEFNLNITPVMAYLIKQELNALKREMDIHEDSRKYTHFYF
ncbi:hypothetical protein ROZALSC1DRAFT_28985 [Rozella allomycis CSF55]|uniref:Uncharacterized protein n=1 Tax=Rozella allomycis (strain CSF55) TaxID=988480 RepID=A0A075B524_ROZAC|nr:hypothetical protein O9G_005273 [Rozella allomycis CSF55]RKP19409.1 hypothetical protein ROZALSC1DRAFT_28985 [Rozella allomycis CSF55]|eukprot:EPZ36856.1 hypothetical protein O9G_005273 [Rozella allomycis CSF55]